MFGTPLGRTRYNDAFAGEAVVSTEGRVNNLFEIRSTNTGSKKIGSYAVTKLNVSLPQYFAAVAYKTHMARDGPPVFSSLTGLSTENLSSRDYQRKLFFVGKLNASVSFDGYTQPPDKISLQLGGSGSMRYFNGNNEALSVGDYLQWEIPDYSDEGKFGQQMSTLQSIPSEDMPKGMIPIFFRPLTQASMREFAIDCMEKFATKPDDYIDVNKPVDKCIKDEKRNTRDPMDNFIVNGIILPHLRNGYIAAPSGSINNGDVERIYIYNAALCLKPNAANKLKIAPLRAGVDIKMVKEFSARALGAQYDAFMDSWSRVVGVALTPAKNGDLTKVLFRP
jgi:hypothetical protein